MFAWGLRYKLSLYDPPHSISRHMPAAKLLTGNERRALPLVGSRPTSSGALAYFTAFCFSLLFLKKALAAPAQAYWASVLALRHTVPAAAPCAAHFIRPPPLHC